MAFTKLMGGVSLSLGTLLSLHAMSLGQVSEKDLLKGPAITKALPLRVPPDDDELKKLHSAHFNEALAEVGLRWQHLIEDVISAEQAIEPARHLLTAGQQVYGRPEDQLTFLKDMEELANYIESLTGVRSQKEQKRLPQLHAARGFRLDVRVPLLKAKRGAEKREK